jgi:hypothetical protein
MPRTPDRRPGAVDEEEILLEDRTADGPPTAVGAIRRNGGDILAFDGVGLFNLRSGTGLTKPQHDALRSLIHFINDGPAEGFVSGAFREILPAASPFPTSVIWWESAAKLQKIVELTITYTGINPTTEEWKMYDTDGTTVLVTVTDTVTYSGVFELSRTRAIV